jgi:hypothetical protein
LARFEFESGIVLFSFSFISVSLGKSRLLVSWCAGGMFYLTFTLVLLLALFHVLCLALLLILCLSSLMDPTIAHMV